MTTGDQFQDIVAEVIRRLIERLEADERNARIIVVFTGATVAFGEAVEQVRSLLLGGFRTQLVFSEAAEHLLASLVKKQLDSFPGVGFVQAGSWLSALKDAQAVVVPMLSVNTVSKLAALIADNLASNVLLHALLMGKPLIMARDGADPDDSGREALGFHKANAALQQAMRQRLRTIEDYGCILTAADRLASTVRSLVALEGMESYQQNSPAAACPPLNPCGPIATAGDVLHAHQLGANLSVGPAARVTPLARDLARQLGVALIMDENP
jgi:hypothetical protein